MITAKSIGIKLTSARKGKNFSQATFAQELAVSPQAVGKWERGESLPDIIVLSRIAALLSVDLNYFSEQESSTVAFQERELPQERDFTELDAIDKKKKHNWNMSESNWINVDFSGIKIGIAPFAQYISKVYPFDLMQEVINQLASTKTYKILLFGGGKKEMEHLYSLSKGKENVVVVAGQLQFHQELQLISNLDVMLSMDSGNSHIAAMLGVKVVTLWGATHPYAGFKPFNQPLENCLTADREKYPLLPTSVYGNKMVPGYEDAMRTIPVDAVVAKINSNLA